MWQAYIKLRTDNEEGFWFRQFVIDGRYTRWMLPVKVQGWVVVFLCFVYVICLALVGNILGFDSALKLFLIALPAGFLPVVLLLFIFRKIEPPRMPSFWKNMLK